MPEWLKSQVATLVIASVLSLGSYQVQAYRVDKLETSVEKYVDLDKRVTVLEMKFDYIAHRLDENQRINAKEFEELKQLIKELKNVD